MLFFQSSPRSSSSINIEKGCSISSYSSSSGTSIKIEGLLEEQPCTFDTAPTSTVSSQHRESLYKRARHHFRSLCRSKTPKVIPFIPKELAFSYAVLPLDALHDPALHSTKINQERATETALIINYYRSQSRIQHTLEYALQTFPKENIFVVGNGNSDSPTNDTSQICTWFGVQHIWIPTRSKVAAQYVGIAAAHCFQYCLLIDEDVALPAEFHVRTDRIETSEHEYPASLKGIGYAWYSVNEYDFQDLEYEMTSLPEGFFDKSGEVGCASFPHGTISLWDRRFLADCFHRHPGHRKSPNWFLGINLALVLQRRSIE